MSKIKLLNIGEVDGVVRLQSQLMVGKDSADFILKNGKLKSWCYENGCSGFYETNISYEIVTNKKEMIRQKL